ncbi:MAG: TadE family protein [Albidovulum sp.]|uniref:TadE/TadG family type IV pilus assembly protein n=1 Tax=Albidovulum sp. TaxID=1872424 RepID=UPI003C9FECC6
MTAMRAWFWRKTQEEDGSATIPFVIFLPFFMTLVMSSLEIGMVMLRQVMLERALDLSVRDLRLDLWDGDYDEFKDLICSRASVIPDCRNAIAVELRPVSTVTWEPLTSGPTCVNRAEDVEGEDLPEFTPGEGDEIMLIRACSKFDPIFPTTGLGLHLPKDNTGAYALISTTAFVNEPELGS